MEANIKLMEEELEQKHDDLNAIKNAMNIFGKKEGNIPGGGGTRSSFLHAGQVGGIMNDPTSSLPRFSNDFKDQGPD